MAGTLCQLDIAKPIEVQIVKDLTADPLVARTLDAVNDAVDLLFLFPSGRELLVTATIFDGPNAKVRYLTLANDFPESGKHKVQARVTIAGSPTEVGCSSIGTIDVIERLSGS